MGPRPSRRTVSTLRILLRGHLLARFERIVESADLLSVETDGIDEHLRSQHMAQTDRQLMGLAYALWRGFGPAVPVQALWGMDEGVAARMLAAVAVAVDPERAKEILEQSLAYLDGATGAPEIDESDDEDEDETVTLRAASSASK